MSYREDNERYERHRAELASRHDGGAEDALRDATADNAGVDCMAYCYGGSPKIDYVDVLADLAEAGWRLTRA